MASLPALVHYAECGQADVTLMLMFGASLFCLFDWMNHRRRDSLWLSAFLMGVRYLPNRKDRLFLPRFYAPEVFTYLSPSDRTGSRYSVRSSCCGHRRDLALPWCCFSAASRIGAGILAASVSRRFVESDS